MQYELSTEVGKVAKAVIKEHLNDLSSKQIVYVTQEKKDDKTGVAIAQMRKGKPVFGDIKLIGGLNAFLASGADRTDHNGPTPFPVLVVSRHAWDLMKPEQRKAFVHQQLNRLDYDLDTGKPSLVDYDVKEFSVIAKLYGAWNDHLSRFLKTAKQHPLFDDIEDPIPVAATPTEPTAAQQAKILKGGNGKANGNGHAKDEAKPKGNGVSDLKAEVARRRGGKPAPART